MTKKIVWGISMKKKNAVLLILSMGLSLFYLHAQDIVQLTPEEIQQNIIENNTYQREIILLDVRDDNEVAAGIIASQYCRPYHLSWNFDWKGRCSDLPKDVPIIIYCRSGHRALQAAAALVDSGYDLNMVAIMQGGTMAYKGTLTSDSSLMKPWSDLPSPSYSNIQTAMRKNTISPKLKGRTPSGRRQQFNLRGQVLRGKALDPDAPVFILERIGDTNRKRVIGIQHLIQNGE